MEINQASDEETRRLEMIEILMKMKLCDLKAEESKKRYEKTQK